MYAMTIDIIYISSEANYEILFCVLKQKDRHKYHSLSSLREPSKRFGQEFNNDKNENNINLSDISNQIYIYFLWYIVQDAKKSVRFHAWPQTNLLFMRRWSNFTIAKIIWMLEGFTRRSGVLCGLFALYMRLYRICVITSYCFLFHFFVEGFSKWNFSLLPEQTVRAGLKTCFSHLIWDHLKQ